jgi:hypothetical protein
MTTTFSLAIGRSTTANSDALPEPPAEWVEFEASQTAEPVLDGLGNTDRFATDQFPGVGSFRGMTLRLFDPDERVWRIRWASTTRPGHLDPPIVGRFVDGEGVFDCDDELDGRPIKVRFVWKRHDSGFSGMGAGVLVRRRRDVGD